MLLQRSRAGDHAALNELMPLVYDDLRLQADRLFKNERRAITLQPTALVSEAYLRLLGNRQIQWNDRNHFFAVASRLMRQILVDCARARNADKRGGGKAALSITELSDVASGDSAGFLALDDAIVRLEKVDAQAAEVVRLRFYAGLNDVGIGHALGISERTARRLWTYARGWLRDTLEQDES